MGEHVKDDYSFLKVKNTDDYVGVFVNSSESRVHLLNVSIRLHLFIYKLCYQ